MKKYGYHHKAGRQLSRFDYGYCYEGHRKRDKSDWAAVGPGDAFKRNIGYYESRQARRLFNRRLKAAQAYAMNLAGAGHDKKPKVKAQIGLCYTNYPAALAAQAAIGLTAFLEFEEWVKDETLQILFQDYTKNPPLSDWLGMDRELYTEMAKCVCQIVQKRLLLQDLHSDRNLSCIETYRLFAASQQLTKLTNTRDIVNRVVMYGDVLPDIAGDETSLNPTVRDMLRDLTDISIPFFDRIDRSPSEKLATEGVLWARKLCRYLARYARGSLRCARDNQQDKAADGISSSETPDASERCTWNGRILPLDGPHPFVFDPSEGKDALRQWVFEYNLDGTIGMALNSSELPKEIKEFTKALCDASRAQDRFEDTRCDLIERSLTIGSFTHCPLEGSVVDGHEIEIDLGDGKMVGGQIHDRVLELSDDCAAVDQLVKDSEPVRDALLRNLYPDVRQVMETERFRTSGLLDPGRLALADISEVVFKRNRVLQKADRRGNPTLLIACDGSASLNANQMRMLKVLTAGWLTSTERSGVRVLAALYHSGRIPRGIDGPLVQWIAHPKSIARNNTESVHALASLPESGTGCQSDALSLGFLFQEARLISKGSSIYAVVITDCAWNSSFRIGKSGQEEVHDVFQAAYDQLGDRLHVTLVALGANDETGFEQLLDRVIPVSSSELSDFTQVAQKIGTYVASCIRERHHLMSKR
jgi:hypothetical protein